MKKEMQERFSLVKAAISVHREDLAALPGVLAVRPGFAARNGEMTNQPAVVVLVNRKTPPKRS
jgi:hypothetical protein